MARSSVYQPVLSGGALGLLLALPARRQRKLGRILFQLGQHPFQLGDFTTTDDQGRILQHVALEDWLIGFWADHAARELRITELEDLRAP